MQVFIKFKAKYFFLTHYLLDTTLFYTSIISQTTPFIYYKNNNQNFIIL